MDIAAAAQIVEPGNRWMQFVFSDKAPGPLRNAVLWIDYPKRVRGECACGSKFPVVIEALPDSLSGIRHMMRGSKVPFYVCKCNNGRVEE